MISLIYFIISVAVAYCIGSWLLLAYFILLWVSLMFTRNSLQILNAWPFTKFENYMNQYEIDFNIEDFDSND